MISYCFDVSNHRRQTIEMALVGWLVFLCFPVAAQHPPWDFSRLSEPVPNPRAEATLKGFVQKVHELNNVIVAEETERTRQRDADRRTTNSSPPPSTEPSAGKPADSGRASTRWVCKYRCTDSGIVNETKGRWMDFEVLATNKSEAQDRALDMAKRVCTVVRKEWGGASCNRP